MKLILFLLIGIIVIFSIGIVFAVQITYPVPELGNCVSQSDCEKYCDNVANIDACLSAAEKYGMMSAEELAEARKMAPYLKSGETPGKCKGQKECDEYCNKDENLMECVEFAKKVGMIDEQEYEMIKKTGGKGPGGCKGKKECDAYCENEANFPTCVDWAVANGLMPASEAEMAKKTKGKGPGNCKGKEACDAYCKDPANIEECIRFSIEMGFITEQEAEMMRKTGGRSPPGCEGKSKEDCNAYCNSPEGQKACSEFACQYGIMTPEECEKMKKNQEFMDSGEGQCFMQCMQGAGVDSKSCGENGAGPEACKTCGEKCFQHDDTSGGRCLSQEKWQQLDSDCKAKGSGYHLEDVKGEDGNGKECVIDMNCVYSSDSQWESQEEKDKRLAEMQQQWDAEKAQHEAQYGPGSGQDGGGSGGCTQPGPNGECNPGPGAGPGPGEGGGSGGSGGGSDGTTSGDSGGSGGGSESSSSDSSSGGSGGESSVSDSSEQGITGSAINDGENDSWLLKFFKWIFRID